MNTLQAFKLLRNQEEATLSSYSDNPRPFPETGVPCRLDALQEASHPLAPLDWAG